MEKRLSTRRLDRLLPLCVLCVLSVLGAGTDSKACMCPLILALESFRFTPHPGSFALVYLLHSSLPTFCFGIVGAVAWNGLLHFLCPSGCAFTYQQQRRDSPILIDVEGQ